LNEHQNCENVLVEDQIQKNVKLCQQKHRAKIKVEKENLAKILLSQPELDLTNANIFASIIRRRSSKLV
jgi:hypothetical protein